MGAAGAGKSFGSGAIAGGGVDGSAMMVTGAVFGSVGVAIDSGFATLTGNSTKIGVPGVPEGSGR